VSPRLLVVSDARALARRGAERVLEVVRAALAAACPAIAAQLPSCRFAVDDEFVADDAPVRPGAVVDVIPPVSGG